MRVRYGLIIGVCTTAGAMLAGSCNGGPESNGPSGPYRQYMRDFVQAISAYAKAVDSDFFVIPQNGPELLALNGEATGAVAQDYVDAIAGVGREDLFYGYDDDDEATPAQDRDYLLGFMDAAAANGLSVLVTDYCSTHANVDDSYAQGAAHGYITFAADDRELRSIPEYPAEPYNSHSDGVTTLGAASNFLYLLNPESFSSRSVFLATLDATEYDVFIIDLFFSDNTSLTAAEVAELQTKPNGRRRLVVCYMSIGEAEDYRYYWQPAWTTSPPDWMVEENPDWPGNFKVEYWDPAWQAVIFGSQSAYLNRILDAGFDGVYLDIIDAFEYFEDRDG